MSRFNRKSFSYFKEFIFCYAVHFFLSLYILGMTQENLAQILQVSRSQISMFELGKRSLPLAATKKLAQMFTYLKDNEMLF